MNTGPLIVGAWLPQEDTRQDDESSLFSEDSIESIFASDHEATSPTAFKEMEKEFKARDKLLDRLARGMDPTYAQRMRENEEAARKQKVALLGLCPSAMKGTIITPDTSMSSHSSSNDSGNELTRLNGVADGKKCMTEGRAPGFDVKNRLQGVVILLLNYVAYNGFEQVIRCFVVFESRNEEFETLHLLPAMLLVLSVCVLCFSGGIWEYVNDETYKSVKFNMNTRLHQGKWDAVVIKWFRRHQQIKSLVNPLAFFTGVYAVYTFQEQAMSWAFDIRYTLFEHLPSVQHGALTAVAEQVAAGLRKEQVQQVLGTSTCAASTWNLDETYKDLTEQDKLFLSSHMAFDCYEDLMGDTSASMVSGTVLFWYYAASTVIAIFVLKKMGHKFWSV